MSELLSIALLGPLVAALLCPLAYRYGGRAAVVVPFLGALAPLVGLYRALRLATAAGEPLTASWPWVESLGLELAFRITGQSGIFALLVAFIGVLIVWYAHGYMAHEEGKGRFFAYLLFFLGAMIGLIVADHVFVTYLFWELTSVSSFLLIGFWHERAESRAGALKALMVTSIGALFMLAGFALLGAKTGAWTWSALATVAPGFSGEAWFGWAFILILIGVFTKSAQFPFHFWLPDAMAAPTPVSAFLHSATMVKAGVFLLFPLFPVFAGHGLWAPVLSGVGITTVVVGAVLALRHTDLKAVLAYTTISQLGLFVALHGFSASLPVLRAALLFHLVAHAFYKGSLFMLTGIIDHETGTRDLRVLGRLWKSMPRTSVFIILAAASLAGLPPFLGFISKEGALEAALHVVETRAGFWWAVPVALTLSAAATAAVAAKIAVAAVFMKPERPEPLKAHDPGWSFLLPPAVLASCGLIFGLFPGALASVLFPAGLLGLEGIEAPKLYLWHGLNTALALSAAAFAGAAVLFAGRRTISRWQERARLGWNLNTVYDGSWDRTLALAKSLTETIFNESLTRYVALTVLPISLLVGGTLLFRANLPAPIVAWPRGLFFEGATMTLVTACAVLVVVLKDRIARLVSLGVAGFLLCVFFVLRGAPDVALTAFLVEIVMLIVALIVFKQLQLDDEPAESKGRGLRALAGFGAGAVFGALVFAMLEFPQAASISGYFLENSKTLAGGFNVVNVILVDFRGYDTLGEITVVALAAMGVFALRRVWLEAPRVPHLRADARRAALPPSEILNAASAVAVPLTLAFSIYMVIRGHNEPGGGFIGGLITVGALVLELLAVGRRRFLGRMRIEGPGLFALGLTMAAGTAIAPLFGGHPFMSHFMLEGSSLGTALVFDLGVYFVVVGATLSIVRLVEETEQKGARP